MFAVLSTSEQYLGSAIDRPGVVGLRITPNLYTTPEELDALVSAIKELSV